MAASSPQRRRLAESFSKLMTACVVLRIEDFTLYRVTTSGKKQMPKEFVSCELGTFVLGGGGVVDYFCRA